MYSFFKRLAQYNVILRDNEITLLNKQTARNFITVRTEHAQFSVTLRLSHTGQAWGCSVPV